MRSTVSTVPSRPHPVGIGAALILIALGTALLTAGCRKSERSGPPVKPYPSIVAPLPPAPVVADEGFPGTWEALAGIEPGVRAFVVGPGDGGPVGGVVIVPSSWGIGREVRNLGRSIAARGFAVVVPDVLEGVEATSRLGMRELAAGISPARAQEVILAGLARLQGDLADQPVAVVALGASSAWVIGLRERARPFSAIAFDTATLAEKDISALAAAGRPVLALFGDDSSAYPLERRITLDDAARRTGLALQLYPVPGAGTELFDVRASSFYAPAYDEALARLEEFLRAPTP
jgi:dienelactone hydrolase